MFASCKRAFKNHVRVVSEFRSTMMQWGTGTKKELAYKTLRYDSAGRLHEELHHTSAKKPPKVADQDVEAVQAYNAPKANTGGAATWRPGSRQRSRQRGRHCGIPKSEDCDSHQKTASTTTGIIKPHLR